MGLALAKTLLRTAFPRTFASSPPKKLGRVQMPSCHQRVSWQFSAYLDQMRVALMRAFLLSQRPCFWPLSLSLILGIHRDSCSLGLSSFILWVSMMMGKTQVYSAKNAALLASRHCYNIISQEASQLGLKIRETKRESTVSKHPGWVCFHRCLWFQA